MITKPEQSVTLAWLLLLLATRCVAGETATALATVTAGYLSGIAVTFGGSGYIGEPGVTITGGGGIGATAKAVLSGDKVLSVIVLTAGSGYTASPTVTISAPPKLFEVGFDLVPKLTIEGPSGGLITVEFATEVSGPWTRWSNVLLGTNGAVLVDILPGDGLRFYRVSSDLRPPAPSGFIWVPPGTFVMGIPPSEPGGSGGGSFDPVEHTVTLTRGFWMSDHEVTQGEYYEVMGNQPSYFALAGDTNLPVEQVSWFDAVNYCQKLTERERTAGRIAAVHEYRLPTEAEWEYAARAGTTGPRYGELDMIAWWYGNSGKQTHPVKQRAPNAWGLYDMLGNVWEWCSDWFGAYPTTSVTDPKGPSTPPRALGALRIKRGGSFDSAGGLSHGIEDNRSGQRVGWYDFLTSGDLGFRVVLSEIGL